MGNFKGAEAVYESMSGKIILIPLLLLHFGCGFCATPLFQTQTAPLTGDAAGLKRFAGRWFDEEGNLIAVISSPPGAQLTVHTPYDLTPKDAHLHNGKIVFRLASDDPEEISLQLTGEDEIQVSVDKGPHATCGYRVLPAFVLVRNPSPAWHMKLTVQKASKEAAGFARWAYDGTMDRLARIL